MQGIYNMEVLYFSCPDTNNQSGLIVTTRYNFDYKKRTWILFRLFYIYQKGSKN